MKTKVAVVSFEDSQQTLLSVALTSMNGYQLIQNRNHHEWLKMFHTLYPASWANSALVGLTWESCVGKKAKGTIGVFFDALYQKHTPNTNAVLWRMGWKM